MLTSATKWPFTFRKGTYVCISHSTVVLYSRDNMFGGMVHEKILFSGTIHGHLMVLVGYKQVQKCLQNDQNAINKFLQILKIYYFSEFSNALLTICLPDAFRQKTGYSYSIAPFTETIEFMVKKSFIMINTYVYAPTEYNIRVWNLLAIMLILISYFNCSNRIVQKCGQPKYNLINHCQNWSGNGQ